MQEPKVQIELEYQDALRLSYMARFPGMDATDDPDNEVRDERIADKVDAAIHEAEQREFA